MRYSSRAASIKTPIIEETTGAVMATKRRETMQRRRAITREGIKRPRETGATKGDIERKLAASATPKHAQGNAVVRLKVNSIRVAEKVFQWRTPQYNMKRE